MAKYSKPTVAVDLDGVLSQYSGWKGINHIDAPVDGAVDFTKKLSRFARIVIWTVRTNGAVQNEGNSQVELLEIVKRWLDKHEFKYDDIYSGPGKPIASAYIDDRAVNCQPAKWGSKAFCVALHEAKWLCEKSPVWSGRKKLSRRNPGSSALGSGGARSERSSS